MPRFYSKFNASMQKEFPFLKLAAGSESVVLCALCDGKFSVENGGRARIKEHIKAQKHCKSTSKVNTNQLRKMRYDGEQEAENDILNEGNGELFAEFHKSSLIDRAWIHFIMTDGGKAVCRHCESYTALPVSPLEFKW